MAETTKAAQAIQVDPYRGGTKLVAMGVGDLLNQYRSNLDDLLRYGDNIWRAARSVLIWWTPARTEQEALRRAADDPAPSIIAEEVAIFTALYEEYAAVAFEVSGYVKTPEERERLKLRLDLMRPTLDGLERRAQAAEARATDYRLRYEFDTLRKVLAGRDAASKLGELLAKAVASLDSAEHLRALKAEVQPVLEKMQQDLTAVRADVGYTAEQVRQEVERRQLPGERVKTALGTFGDVATAGGVVAQLLAAAGRLIP